MRAFVASAGLLAALVVAVPSLPLLAENPEARVSYPKRVLYDAVQAAELDEPGAIKALSRAETLGKHPVSGPARSL